MRLSRGDSNQLQVALNLIPRGKSNSLFYMIVVLEILELCISKPLLKTAVFTSN